MQRLAHVEDAVAGVDVRHQLRERRGRAGERACDLGCRPVAVRRPHHRRRGCHDRGRERRAAGVISGLERRSRGTARRDDLDPLSPARRDRRPSRASTSSRPGSRSPAASSPTPSTPGCEAGNLGLGSVPLLPTAATTSAPESCSARSDSTSAVVGFAVAEMLTTCAPFRRSQPSASRRPCSSVVVIAAVLRLDDSGGQQRRVRHEAYDAHVGTVRDEDAGHRGAVPDGVVRRHLPARREMQQRRLEGREAIVVDTRVGHADDDSRGRALAEMDRSDASRVGLHVGLVPTASQPSSASSTGASRST